MAEFYPKTGNLDVDMKFFDLDKSKFFYFLKRKDFHVIFKSISKQHIKIVYLIHQRDNLNCGDHLNDREDFNIFYLEKNKIYFFKIRLRIALSRI